MTSRKPSRPQLERSHVPRWRLILLGVMLLAMMLFSAGPFCRAMAQSAIEKRNYEAGASWLRRARNCGSNGAEQLMWEARLARKTYQPSLAKQKLQLAQAAGLNADRGRRELLLLQADLGQPEAEAGLRDWLIQSADDNAEVCESLATLLLMNGRTDQALQVISTWKASFPDDPQPYLTLGRWLEANENIDTALAEYKAALEVRAGYAPVLYAMGRLYANREQWTLARSFFESASSELNDNFAPNLCLADSLYQLGDIQSARSLLEQLRMAPEAQIREGFALVQDPLSMRTADGLLGELLTGLGQYAPAIPLLENALASDSRNRSLRYALAQCLEHAGRIDEGRQLLRQVATDGEGLAEAASLAASVQVHPDQPQIEQRLQIARLYLEYGSPQQGIFWLRSVLSFDASHSQARQLLADCEGRQRRAPPVSIDPN